MVQTTVPDRITGDAFLTALSVANIVLLVSPALALLMAALQVLPSGIRRRVSMFVGLPVLPADMTSSDAQLAAITAADARWDVDAPRKSDSSNWDEQSASDDFAHGQEASSSGDLELVALSATSISLGMFAPQPDPQIPLPATLPVPPSLPGPGPTVEQLQQENDEQAARIAALEHRLALMQLQAANDSTP